MATTTARPTLPPPLSFKVLTFNIWFDQLYRTARTRCIANLLVGSGADIICLQEVTAASYNTLMSGSPPDSSYLTSHYDVSPVPPLSSYFALMLVRKTFQAQFAIVNLPSMMGRQLVVARTVVPLPAAAAGVTCAEQQSSSSRALVVATNHFESLDSRRTRRQQLEVALERALQGAGRWVLCGDFNFCSYQNFRGLRPEDLENTVLKAVLPPHADVWETLHPQTLDPAILKKMRATDDGALGYTFDSHRNENIRHPEQMRYDRVLVSVPSLRPTEVSLVGVEAVPESCFERQHRRSANVDMSTSGSVGGTDGGEGGSDVDDDDEQVGRLQLPPGRPVKCLTPPVGATTNSDAFSTPHRGGGCEHPTTPPLQGTSYTIPLTADEMTTPLLPRHPTVFPSDHFGVVCRLEVV